jgi:hypothetical protein
MLGGLEIGILGLILLGLIIWAMIHIVQSNASMLAKVLWVLVLLFFPFFGFLVWLIFGPRKVGM